jgi:hypothetical protein
MRALLREDSQKLLEWFSRFAHLKLNVKSIAPNQVGGKRSVMIRIVPIPADAALVVVGKDPS